MKTLRIANLLTTALLALAFTASSQAEEAPTTLGYAADDYTVGEVLYDSGFENPKDWNIQIEKSDSKTKPKVKFKKGMLDIYMPDRGSTAWLMKKFEGPILISYRVKCPEETLSFPEIQARDINNFWHASDPVSGDGLFDSSRYDGGFGSYHKMHGYYASTGGGGNEGNHTTRFRRYPRRDLEANDVAHIALNDRDEDPDYLITPGKWHSVQLVAANGMAQYIVDGKIVYQIKEGDEITIEESGKTVRKTNYDLGEFSAHTSGYFGLRLVKSHHQYADLKIYQLERTSNTLDIKAYLDAADEDKIAPSTLQVQMLEALIPEHTFQPAPPISDRIFWERVAASESGQAILKMARSELEIAPEVPITDELYREAGKTGDRTLYKPRYYDTMSRLEHFLLAECIENEGNFLPQTKTYIRAILDMKSWLHPNHDRGNQVLEGNRMSIDLGSRLFGSILAIADLLLEDKLSAPMREEIAQELDLRIVQSFLSSCQQTGTERRGPNSWIRGTSNWNSVCTSGSTFVTIAMSSDREERLIAVGSALNAMRHYLSGFGQDGFCSEGIGYWGYGFGHYLYLAQILHDYTNGKVDLFTFDDPERLRNIGSFPSKYHIQQGIFPAFSDSNIWNPASFGNFARAMVAKHYDSEWPYDEVHEHSIEQLIQWTALSDSTVPSGIAASPVSYFDDRGVVVSRGQQEDPFSIALKAGDNNENHNHSDVGSYSIVLGKVLMAGDIGKPIYKAGAFGSQNKSRNSWGHPVPRVDGQLQSDGAEHFGKVLDTDFSAERDWVEIDLSAAYVVDSLETLVRTYENQKSDTGTITIVDRFEASKAIEFGTAIMSYADFEQTGPNTILLTNNGKSVEVEITSEGGAFEIQREMVPVDLQSYLTAYRIGIDFVDPTSSGSISMRFTPVDTLVEETPKAYAERMQWWRDSKFGMFIHWGAYSQAGGEWKGDPNHGEWLQFSAKIPLAEYQELARSFNPVEFDADEWVRIAKNAGMKYMVITAKHHDGFALFKSRATPYNIVDWSVYGKDAIKQLAEACHRGGLKFGVYYSLGRDWHHPDVPTGGTNGRPAGDRSNLIDFPDESIKDFKIYYQRKVLPQLRELLTQNGPIDIVWFDTPEKTSEAQSHELVQMIHSLHPNCIVNSRVGNGLGDFGTPEQKIPSGPNAKPWETCMTVSTRFWGYNKSISFRESSDLIRNLIDITSKGGNYLLNVGPTGAGIIPQPSVDRLSAMGDWLKVNGEAIYGCGPTPFGPEVGAYSETETDKNGKPTFVSKWEWRATTAPGKLFVHIFDWSSNFELPPVDGSIQKVYLLADPAKTELTFTQSENGVSIQLPENAPDKVASVLCFELGENAL